MPVLGVTGGIASGKTTVSRDLAEILQADLFDSDLCARELCSRALILGKLRSEFGGGIFDAKGELDREALRAIVFGDAGRRRALEAILHPEIRATWMNQASAARQESRWLLVDIPLLFETGAESHLDATIVVGCEKGTQLKRLKEIRGIEEALASRIIATQMEISAKVLRANHVIWNDSTKQNLKEQVTLLSGLLHSRYG